MNIVCLDIETISCRNAHRIDYLLKTLKAPANYKGSEAIARWFNENREKAVDKTVFDGAFGEIVTIGFQFGDGDIKAIQRTDTMTEEQVLQEFFDKLKDYAKECNISPRLFRPLFIGHNLIEFDLRFMFKRCVILNINTHEIDLPKDSRHGSGRVFDTMIEWVGFKSKSGGSMSNICDALDIPGKGGFDGSMVGEAFNNKNYNIIAEYCRDDVDRTLCRS